MNNDPEYPDPFDGKFEIEIDRSEYNEYVRNGRLKIQVWDNFYPVNESDFDWAKETPEGYDVHEKKRAVDFGPVLEKVFDGTRFRITLSDPLIGIEDDTGLYLDWDFDERLTINDIINQFRQEVNISQDDELREEYREVYMLLLNYFT